MVEIADLVTRRRAIALAEQADTARWYCRPDMEELGMHCGIVEAFDRLCAVRLLRTMHRHYPSLTGEFMATLEIPPSPAYEDVVIFQLGNRVRRLTLQQMSQAFGFTHTTTAFTVADPNIIWRYLTGTAAPNPTTSFNRDIVSPLFRMILRVLGSIIWARPELQRPTHRETECLRCILFESKPLPLAYA